MWIFEWLGAAVVLFGTGWLTFEVLDWNHAGAPLAILVAMIAYARWITKRHEKS